MPLLCCSGARWVMDTELCSESQLLWRDSLAWKSSRCEPHVMFVTILWRHCLALCGFGFQLPVVLTAISSLWLRQRSSYVGLWINHLHTCVLAAAVDYRLPLEAGTA